MSADERDRRALATWGWTWRVTDFSSVFLNRTTQDEIAAIRAATRILNRIAREERRKAKKGKR